MVQLLRRCGGALELVDVSMQLPGLQRMQGLHTWFVREKGQLHASWQACGQVCHAPQGPGLFASSSMGHVPVIGFACGPGWRTGGTPSNMNQGLLLCIFELPQLCGACWRGQCQCPSHAGV